MSTIDKWLDESEENRRIFAQEGLIIEVSEAVWGAMEKRKWSKAQLAEALHTSRAYVTRLLNGSRNMTLRTLADIAFVLGFEVETRFVDKAEAKQHLQYQAFVKTPVEPSHFIATIRFDNACNEPGHDIPISEETVQVDAA